MLVKRELLGKIEPFLKRKEYLAIVGPRQSGKTTFLKILRQYLVEEKISENDLIHTITFEDRKMLSEFDSDPVRFVKSFTAEKAKSQNYLFFDEFQYVKKGGQKLKLVYDTVPDVRIVVTGSSSMEIKAQLGKYMVGRVLTFNMLPFTFCEVLEAKNKRLHNLVKKEQQNIHQWIFEDKEINIKKGEDEFSQELAEYFEDYCIWGGYPAVDTAENDRIRFKILNDIYNNYVLKDVKGLLELATEKNLYLLTQYLATQTGNLIVYNNLGQAAGLDYRGLKKHLNIIKETFVCDELKPYYVNKQKELAKNPKIYFLDTGFRNNIIENFAILEKRSDAGALVENAAYILLLNKIKDLPCKINFWRTKAGAEVDFVLRTQGNIIPVEVKYSKFTKPGTTRSYMSFLESLKPNRGVVLTKNYWDLVKKGNTEIMFVPIYYL